MTEVKLVALMIAATGLLLYIARLVSIPQSLLLIVSGIAVGLIPGLPRFELNPFVVFDLILPPLLFAGTVSVSRGLLRRNLTPALLLGAALIFATIAVVAFFAREFLGIAWSSAVLLGIIATIGGVDEYNEVNQQLHLPRIIGNRLRAEGLLAPVVGVSTFLIAQQAGQTGEFSWNAAVFKFAADVIGGGLIGAGVGFLFSRLVRPVNNAGVEIAVALATPFTLVLLVSTFNLSAIPAILAAGFIIAADSIDSHTGKARSSPDTRLAAESFWNVFKQLIGGLFLFLIGLSLPAALRGLTRQSFWTLGGYTLIILVIALLMRFVFAYIVAVFERRAAANLTVETSEPQPLAEAARKISPLAEAATVTWAGTRSGIGVVVALAIPTTTSAGEPFPGRDLIVALTCLLTLFSITIQGLTLAPLVRWFGLHDSDDVSREEVIARHNAARNALDKLAEHRADEQNDKRDRNGFQHRQFDKLRRYYERRLRETSAGKFGHNGHAKEATTLVENVELSDDEQTRFILLRDETLNAERCSLLAAYNQNSLGEETYQKLLKEIDVEAKRLETDEE